MPQENVHENELEDFISIIHWSLPFHVKSHKLLIIIKIGWEKKKTHQHLQQTLLIFSHLAIWFDFCHTMCLVLIWRVQPSADNNIRIQVKENIIVETLSVCIDTWLPRSEIYHLWIRSTFRLLTPPSLCSHGVAVVSFHRSFSSASIVFFFFILAICSYNPIIVIANDNGKRVNSQCMVPITIYPS